MYLAAGLKKHGHEVQLASIQRVGLDGLERRMREFQPAVVAYSIMTGEHIKLLEINRGLKQHFKFLSVFGGPHATFSPSMIEDEPECDALCVGEGDLAFPEFCRRVEAGEAYWESPNFWVRHEGTIYRNPLLPLVVDLDELPFPDHDLMYECDPEIGEEGTKTFYSGRGCPYACTYCFNGKYNEIYHGKGPIMRYRSPKHLVDEILYVKERYPLTNVFMHDDTFIAKPAGWFEEFCPDYTRRVGLPMSCCVRANLVTEPVVALLSEAGLRSAWMGVECGDERAANEVLKRKLKNVEIQNAAEILKRHGVLLVTQNLNGLPVPNSYETDLKTVDLNVRLGPAYAWSSILYPYPGTPIEAYAREHGFLPPTGPPLLETNKRSSAFLFPTPIEKRKVENLHKLFDLMVQHPMLRRHCDFLCALPLSGLYRMVYYLRFGYVFKWKLFPFRSVRKELGKFVRLFVRMVRKT